MVLYCIYEYGVVLYPSCQTIISLLVNLIVNILPYQYGIYVLEYCTFLTLQENLENTDQTQIR